ncbi:MAG: thiamine-monophosphate kinase, partial [Candidatus Latescibacterota bacterium]
MKEREIIDRIRAAFPQSGIGDDTAVLPAAAGDLLLASDAVVENVHFVRRRSTLSQAIQKAVTANVSDVYAMGGRPEAILLSAGLPPGCSAEDVDSIVEGLSVSCEAYGVRLAGGDTVASPGGYFFDVAIAGSVPRGRAVRRSGARAGDAVVLFGEVGPSLAGLSLLAAFLGPCGCGGSPPPAPRLRD